MSKSTIAPTPVSAARVREAFREGLFVAPDAALPSLVGKKTAGVVRGRLNPLAVQAFNEQVKGEVYGGEKSVVESKTATLPTTKMNAAGARLKRPVTLSLKEVRVLAGVPGKKGRLSKVEVEAATAAYEAREGWDTKPAKKAPKGRTVNASAPVEATPEA